MNIKTETSIDSGEDLYLITTASSVRSEWDNSLSDYVMRLELDQVEELYYQLKEIICQ